MRKHTKGPWQVLTDVDSHRDYARIFAGSTLVGLAVNSDATHKERYANAYLIAAAPELLEALKRIIENDKTSLDPDDHMFAREVIAKANGERLRISPHGVFVDGVDIS